IGAADAAGRAPAAGGDGAQAAVRAAAALGGGVGQGGAPLADDGPFADGAALALDRTTHATAGVFGDLAGAGDREAAVAGLGDRRPRGQEPAADLDGGAEA